ncbi:MAG TPA: hypothetical protein VNJ02_11230 [Vicinamibacterales bacterium]|nr:hypothetical protein [Vicinamibacterales bacterium]
MAKKKAKRSASKTNRVIRINARGVAQAIVREVKVAQKAVAHGERALAAATKSGRQAEADRNQKTLDRARRVLAAREAAQAIAFPRTRAGKQAMVADCPFDTMMAAPFRFE